MTFFLNTLPEKLPSKPCKAKPIAKSITAVIVANYVVAIPDLEITLMNKSIFKIKAI